ncbi:MAG: hypothetical protein ACRDE2_07725 [Chitinophagaceae bacterium]
MSEQNNKGQELMPLFSSFELEQFNLTYFPRYNFIERDNSSVSVGLPVGFGLGLVIENYGNPGSIAGGFDVPVVLDYNIGYKSTMDNDSRFGGYFGVGFGYLKDFLDKNDNLGFTGAIYGPMIRGGFRFGGSGNNWDGHGLTAGIFYKEGIESMKMHTLGFNMMYNL